MRTTLAVLVAALCATHLGADTMHVASDTMVNQKAPSESYGLWPNVTVRSGSEIRHGYVRFDLGPLADLPAGTTVDRAVLRAYAALVVSPGSIEIHPVLTPWQEGSLAWSGAPTLAPSAGTFVVANADRLGFVTADVTTVVRDWL